MTAYCLNRILTRSFSFALGAQGIVP